MTADHAKIISLLNSGMRAQAMALARAQCEQQPDNPDTWYLRAMVHTQMGHWQDVASCCRQVITLQPTHLEAHYNLATALGCLLAFSEAAPIFARVIELAPTFTPAYVGLAKCQLLCGQTEPALATLEQGQRTAGDHPELDILFGETLLSLGRVEAAAQHYVRALSANAQNANAQYGMGRIAQILGRTEEAMTHFQKAIALNPKLADAHGRLGMLLSETGRREEAIRCFKQVLTLQPDHLDALINCGHALHALGQLQEAETYYQRAVTAYPESELAQYFAATLGTMEAPQQSPRAYVKQMFDDYASRFEHHLVNKLKYSAPQVLGEQIHTLFSERTSAPLAALDLGCGTGLAGAAVRDIATTLVGVDLSERMIEEARTKNLYDGLHVAEVGEFIAPYRAAFDLIMATDVFIYIGDLDALFEHCAAALRPGGLFAFSIERHTGEAPYVLRPSSRYAHSHAYIRSLAAKTGLEKLIAKEHILREEGETPVQGDLFILRRPA